MIDNGFLRFDHVRVPRENMLAKNAKASWFFYAVSFLRHVSNDLFVIRDMYCRIARFCLAVYFVILGDHLWQ